METRANFILVGAFTLLGIIGALGFFLWLAKVQVDRQYETYGILFEDVSGLDAALTFRVRALRNRSASRVSSDLGRRARGAGRCPPPSSGKPLQDRRRGVHGTRDAPTHQ